MSFDHKKFIADRQFGNPVTGADVADFDSYAALYTLSMTPGLINAITAINTIQFTKLSKHTQAKVMEWFNKKPISDGYIRAYPSEINAVNQRRERIMDVYDVSMLEADMLQRYGLVDMDLINEFYEYKTNGILPKAKKAKRGKKEEKPNGSELEESK